MDSAKGTETELEPETTAPSPATTSDEATRRSSPPPPRQEAAAAVTTAQSVTLEQEFTNVIAGLGSFWGKMKKQSVNALAQAEKQIESARKDLVDPLLVTAKANLDSLSEQTRFELQRLTEEAGSATSASAGIVIGPDGMPIMIRDVIDDPPPPPPLTRPVERVETDEQDQTSPRQDSLASLADKKGKGVDRSEHQGHLASTTSSSSSAATADIAASATAFFNKVQSQLSSNPNVQGISKNLTTLQETVSSNLSTLPTSFQTNLHQLQTQFDSKTAEEFLQKGENWFTEFGSEVSRLAREAVQVVPPGSSSSLLSSSSSANEKLLSAERARKKEERMRKAERVAGGRREMHLGRLRSDPSLLLDDPERPNIASTADARAEDGDTSTISISQQHDTSEPFKKFVADFTEQGALQSETWQTKIKDELEKGGDALEGTFRILVPSRMTELVFWSRYFFRVWEIDEDENRRKLVLKGVENEKEEEFSWDMEEEEEEQEREEEARNSVEVKMDTRTAEPVGDESSTTKTSDRSTPNATLSSKVALVSRASSVSAGSDWGLDSNAASENNEPTPPRNSTVGRPRASGPPSPSKASSPDTNNSVGAGTSPRVSSEGTAGSYDLVGMTSGTPSERGVDEADESGARTKVPLVEQKRNGGDDSDDSDWE